MNKSEEAPDVEHPNFGHPHPHVRPPYDGYFEYNEHLPMDYSKPGPDKLPGPDFNKKVFNFNTMRQIWGQKDYESRLNVEAEMMVALEALKTSVRFVTEDIHKIQGFLKEQYLGIQSVVLENDFRELDV